MEFAIYCCLIFDHLVLSALGIGNSLYPLVVSPHLAVLSLKRNSKSLATTSKVDFETDLFSGCTVEVDIEILAGECRFRWRPNSI